MNNFNPTTQQLPTAPINSNVETQEDSSSTSQLFSAEHTLQFNTIYTYYTMKTTSFLTYYSRHEVPNLSRNEAAIRRLILDFKEGKDYAREFVEEYVCEYLRATFTPEELRTIYFTPVPAATMDRSCDRWCIFTHDICRELGTLNGYDLWCNHEDLTPTHVTRMENGDDGNRPRNYFFMKDVQGARCIIFDDILSTGASLRVFAEALREEGAEVLEAVTLAKC